MIRFALHSAGVAALAVTATAAFASGATIVVNPNPVPHGQFVRVHGSVPSCHAGDAVTLISKAFSHRHQFAGVSAVFATVRNNHSYSVRTRIPARRRPGSYAVSGRCGGGNLGVSATLRVVR